MSRNHHIASFSHAGFPGMAAHARMTPGTLAFLQPAR